MAICDSIVYYICTSCCSPLIVEVKTHQPSWASKAPCWYIFSSFTLIPGLLHFFFLSFVVKQDKNLLLHDLSMRPLQEEKGVNEQSTMGNIDLLVLGHVLLSSVDTSLSSSIIYYAAQTGDSFSFTYSINQRGCHLDFNRVAHMQRNGHINIHLSQSLPLESKPELKNECSE